MRILHQKLMEKKKKTILNNEKRAEIVQWYFCVWISWAPRDIVKSSYWKVLRPACWQFLSLPTRCQLNSGMFTEANIWYFRSIQWKSPRTGIELKSNHRRLQWSPIRWAWRMMMARTVISEWPNIQRPKMLLKLSRVLECGMNCESCVDVLGKYRVTLRKTGNTTNVREQSNQYKFGHIANCNWMFLYEPCPLKGNQNLDRLS